MPESDFSALNRLSKLEISWIICSSLLYGFYSSAVIGIPLMFQEPLLLCKDNSNTKGFFKCLEEYACLNSNSLNIIIDPKGPKSLRADFKLICEETKTLRFSMFIIFLGGLIGCLINFLFKVETKNKKILLGFNALFLYGIPSLLCLIYYDNLNYISIFLSIQSISYLILLAYFFNFINEIFEEKIYGLITTFCSLIYGVFGIIHPMVNYFFHSNWKTVLVLNSLGGIFCGIFILILPPTKKFENLCIKQVKILIILNNVNFLW